jgi:hypothetical protein
VHAFLPLPTLLRLVKQALASALAAWFAVSTGYALAGQQDTLFKVTVNLLPSTTTSAYCTTNNGKGSFGATVTVVCGTGAIVDLAAPAKGGVPWVPMHGGAYRYVTQLSRAGEGPGTVDVYGLTGTITTWRTVNLLDRSYTEMTVSW